ncbi:MAG: transcriptional regulator, LuxR family [Chlorobi bacterium]|nr:transcriptional regulator, LuxR family [Chlorobiota bacterium]
MPRKRDVAVSESLKELLRLEARYKGKPEAARILMLKLLKESPEREFEDVVPLVNYSRTTVKRWWRLYRGGGIDALLNLSTRVRERQPGQPLHALKKKLDAGEFTSIDDVQTWIDLIRAKSNGSVEKGRIGVSENLNGAYNRHVPAIPQSLPQGGASESDRLFRFLEDLPVTHNLDEWVGAFKAALRELLQDVDRITVSLNAQCDLINPDKYEPNVFVAQSVTTGQKTVDPGSMESGEDSRDPFKRLLDYLHRVKFPFEDYHTPHSQIFYFGRQAYLGTILLWRDRGNPPISQETVHLMERLHGFLILILSDFVARHRVARPLEHVFNAAFSELARETGLTMQERRIFILLLIGLSYEEVAKTLNISVNTVRYHLRSLYNKTGTHGQTELFAKYFTPRYDPPASQK